VIEERRYRRGHQEKNTDCGQGPMFPRLGERGGAKITGLCKDIIRIIICFLSLISSL